MVIEKFIRYAGPAVGLKPSAMECEARLRGLVQAAQAAFALLAEPFRATAGRRGEALGERLAQPACAGSRRANGY